MIRIWKKLNNRTHQIENAHLYLKCILAILKQITNKLEVILIFLISLQKPNKNSRDLNELDKRHEYTIIDDNRLFIITTRWYPRGVKRPTPLHNIPEVANRLFEIYRLIPPMSPVDRNKLKMFNIFT